MAKAMMKPEKIEELKKSLKGETGRNHRSHEDG